MELGGYIVCPKLCLLRSKSLADDVISLANLTIIPRARVGYEMIDSQQCYKMMPNFGLVLLRVNELSTA